MLLLYMYKSLWVDVLDKMGCDPVYTSSQKLRRGHICYLVLIQSCVFAKLSISETASSKYIPFRTNQSIVHACM